MIATLEGILFLCGDEGIRREELKQVMQINDEELVQLVAKLSNLCLDQARGIQVAEYGDILKFITKPGNEEFYKKLVQVDIDRPITPTMLEMLAIIAYNQPITRMEIDQLRGVSSFHVLRKLLIKELVSEKERSNTPGRPILYQTTSKFLDALGINSLDQLPTIKEFTANEELDLFNNKIDENRWLYDIIYPCRSGGIGRREGLKHLW